jgi:hypothetical protein
VVIEASNGGKVVSDAFDVGPLKFNAAGDILAGALSNGNIQLWHVPDGAARTILEGDGSPIRAMYFSPDGLEMTATSAKGKLLYWRILPALSLSDDMLMSVARSAMPLHGSLLGRLGERATPRPVASTFCRFDYEHNLGLPPHKLTGAARARELISIPDPCRLRPGKATALRSGLISQAEGDFVNAYGRLVAAVAGGEWAGEIALGDMGFVDGFDGISQSETLGHYTRAYRHGVPRSASRIGWLLLASGTENAAVRAKGYFEESIKDDDADGFAGLAWIYERFGTTPSDIEAAFANYVRAQFRYERDGDLLFATRAAERRAMLGHVISPTDLAKLFLATRKSIAALKGRP